jgi:hypothetical protein
MLMKVNTTIGILILLLFCDFSKTISKTISYTFCEYLMIK